MAEVKRLFYQLVLKRTSTYCLAMVCSAVVFERTYDHACEYVFEKVNEGKLWMHIKHKYKETPDEVHNSALTPVTSLERLSRRESEAAKSSKNSNATGKKNGREDANTR